MTEPRTRHTATLLMNAKVLITGGDNFEGRSLATAELYDPVTGSFTATGNMTTGRSGHSATLLPDGRVLIAGGSTDVDRLVWGSYLGIAEIYDPSTETFTATGNMVNPQAGHTATLLDNGKVLITGGEMVGGYYPGSITEFHLAVDPELYDPVTGAFLPAGKYAKTGPQNPSCDQWGTGMIGVAALLLPNQKVFIAGEPSTELYDPLTGTFSLAGTMAIPRWGIPCYIEGRTGTLLATGKVLLAGGEQEDLGYFADAELYDPSTGQFTAIANMTRNRDDHTATLLRDGTVLLAGAQYGGAVVASTELYDPASSTFTASADMTFGRFFHTATLLMDGRILMAGGYTSYPASPNSNSAELYVPSVLVPAQVVGGLRFDRTTVATGSSFSANVSGSNLTSETFFDVRFIAPGSEASNVVLNWQRGLVENHDVPAGLAPGSWRITGVRAHEIDTDHTGIFFPVSATITVSP